LAPLPRPCWRQLEGARFVEKTHFSCVADGCLAGTEVDLRRQVVVVGTEAHVCVMQTVLELRWQGKEVFLVEDAVGSRKPGDKQVALARMRAHGVEVVTREMVAFEWLKRSATELFREVNRDFIRDN
jgi:nicotinamidase-related amidase